MHYDMVIIGGGLVGAGFAASLSELPIKIALIDARMPSNNDGRLFALNYGSCQFLKNLGLWSQLVDKSGAIHQVHVSHKGHFGATRLNREDASLDALGYVVPAKHIEHALNQKIANQHNLDIYRPAQMQTLLQEEASVKISLEQDGKLLQLTAGMVFGADGAESTVREQANIEVERIDYQQVAIVTRTQLKRSNRHVAYERFVKSGAIAMLPLPGDECATIWSTDCDNATRLLALDDEAFLQELQQDFGYRLGRLLSVSRRFSYPLKLIRATESRRDRVFLLGNAAHAVHPIAAQGFNLAIYEVALLVELIESKIKSNNAISPKDFDALSQQIKKQQKISISVSHKLADIFATDLGAKQAFLQLGMMGLDLALPVKQRFVTAILGRAGRVPKLLIDGTN